MSALGRVIVVLVVAYIVVPPFRERVTRLTAPSKTVTLPASEASAKQTGAEAERELKIVTVVGFDSIPAILKPEFVVAEEAGVWMASDEQVLGLSINGDQHAYSPPMLSSHKIVNDTVGGVPVAVSW